MSNGERKQKAQEARMSNGERRQKAEARPRNWLMPMMLLSLQEWNSYGYELMERTAALGFQTMNPGTLYRALRQLEKDGHVKSKWETSGAGPARRMYSITDAGEAYLALWATSLKQFRQTMDAFFELYTNTPPRRIGEKKDAE